jgi:hypothetical protein
MTSPIYDDSYEILELNAPEPIIFEANKKYSSKDARIGSRSNTVYMLIHVERVDLPDTI